MSENNQLFEIYVAESVGEPTVRLPLRGILKLVAHQGYMGDAESCPSNGLDVVIFTLIT